MDPNRVAEREYAFMMFDDRCGSDDSNLLADILILISENSEVEAILREWTF